MSRLTPMSRRRSSISAMVSISRLATLTGVTPRALRHYEAVGLLRPHRGPNGVRVFDADDCAAASLIVAMRRCDIPLRTIREALSAETTEDRVASMMQALRAKEMEMVARLQRVRAVLSEQRCDHRSRAA